MPIPLLPKVNPNGISFNFPETIMNDIQGILLGLCPDLEDRLICAYFKDSSFSLKSAYLLAKCLNLLNLASHHCRWVWDAYTTPRIIIIIIIILWLVSRNSIPTRVVLGSRGFNLCLTCEVWKL